MAMPDCSTIPAAIPNGNWKEGSPVLTPGSVAGLTPKRGALQARSRSTAQASSSTVANAPHLAAERIATARIASTRTATLGAKVLQESPPKSKAAKCSLGSAINQDVSLLSQCGSLTTISAAEQPAPAAQTFRGTAQAKSSIKVAAPRTLEEEARWLGQLACSGAADGRELPAALNQISGCLMRANSYQHAGRLAEEVVAGAGPALMDVMVHLLSGGDAAAAVLALNAMQCLAASPKVCQAMLDAGMLPLLLGLLRGGASCLEPLLSTSILRQLHLMMSTPLPKRACASTALKNSSSSTQYSGPENSFPGVNTAFELSAPQARAAIAAVASLIAKTDQPTCRQAARLLLQQLLRTPQGICAATASPVLQSAVVAAAQLEKPGSSSAAESTILARVLGSMAAVSNQCGVAKAKA